MTRKISKLLSKLAGLSKLPKQEYRALKKSYWKNSPRKRFLIKFELLNQIEKLKSNPPKDSSKTKEIKELVDQIMKK